MESTTIFYVLTTVLIAPILYVLYGPKLFQLSITAVLFALLSGIVSIAAIVGFNIALEKGGASVVVPITSLYRLSL